MGAIAAVSSVPCQQGKKQGISPSQFATIGRLVLPTGGSAPVGQMLESA
jgi:hypothetical protein